MYWTTRAARLMVGIPDYETYVAHRRTNHPDQPIMTYVEFVRERQEAVMPSVRGGSGAVAKTVNGAEKHQPTRSERLALLLILHGRQMGRQNCLMISRSCRSILRVAARLC